MKTTSFFKKLAKATSLGSNKTAGKKTTLKQKVKKPAPPKPRKPKASRASAKKSYVGGTKSMARGRTRIK